MRVSKPQTEKAHAAGDIAVASSEGERTKTTNGGEACDVGGLRKRAGVAASCAGQAVGGFDHELTVGGFICDQEWSKHGPLFRSVHSVTALAALS